MCFTCECFLQNTRYRDLVAFIGQCLCSVSNKLSCLQLMQASLKELAMDRHLLQQIETNFSLAQVGNCGTSFCHHKIVIKCSYSILSGRKGEKGVSWSTSTCGNLQRIAIWYLVTLVIIHVNVKVLYDCWFDSITTLSENLLSPGGLCISACVLLICLSKLQLSSHG
jgi:hypothetical protein